MDRKLTLFCVSLLSATLSGQSALADDALKAEAESNHAKSTPFIEDTDGVLLPGEYMEISQNGGLTRALCPYTCEDHGIPKEHCRTWPSKMDHTLCYVWDTRLPNDAVPLRQ